MSLDQPPVDTQELGTYRQNFPHSPHFADIDSTSMSLVWKSTADFRASRISAAEWEMQREEICQLYNHTSLDELMAEMKARRGFTPT